jgi:hypothetical protein
MPGEDGAAAISRGLRHVTSLQTLELWSVIFSLFVSPYSSSDISSTYHLPFTSCFLGYFPTIIDLVCYKTFASNLTAVMISADAVPALVLHRGCSMQEASAAALSAGLIHVQSLKTLVLRSVCTFFFQVPDKSANTIQVMHLCLLAKCYLKLHTSKA